MIEVQHAPSLSPDKSMAGIARCPAILAQDKTVVAAGRRIRTADYISAVIHGISAAPSSPWEGSQIVHAAPCCPEKSVCSTYGGVGHTYDGSDVTNSDSSTECTAGQCP